MLDPRLKRATEGGMSVIVGTADAEGSPACCRAIAMTSEDDLATATVYVPVTTGQETIANIATTRRIAISVSHPLEHTTMQFKGTTRGVRLARDSESSLVRTRLDQFADELEKVGLPRSVGRSMSHWPAFAIEVAIHEIYDQTPGPKAGDPFQ